MASRYLDWDTYENGWLNYDETTPGMMKEVLECFVGRRIGKGSAREVFECKADPTLVIKFQTHFDNQNAIEAAMWDHYEGTEFAKWLAPVVAHSSSYRVIVQKRTAPLTRLPAELPSFLSDTKTQNYGMLDGRVVCHDYGLIISSGSDKAALKPRKVKWWTPDGVLDVHGRAAKE